ncbi:Na+/H+ antiporter [Roseomonas sp. JC162]|uniref:Na+/H+ antiporter n=1 Tax=Neoroseomonas marina TaxID=1232220 RepID=A0A848EDG8_9PROT|nr:Na+/H+ antiporter [Neoroseomonas marina]NMJ42624.1 Na+/H+ antiporter [Neoroseomonas marina]
MPIVQALLALIAACIGFALLARRARLPYAVVLVLGGMVLAFIPGAPKVELDPDLALAFFLPPLLMASAYRTDWRAFTGNIRPILFLALGAVLFTAVCVALAALMVIPWLPFSAAIALGAIVAPPDAVAAGAVLHRLRLPKGIVAVLEGESLINDASALVLYRLAVAATLASAYSWAEAGFTFIALAIGGAMIGWLLGRGAILAIRRLEDTLLETAMSFIACFASYFAAEFVHVSGVIAVVVTGLVLGRAQHALSARTRREARVVWQFIEFVLNSLVFILIGLQLNEILGRMDHYGVWQLASCALVVSAALIVSRFIWVFPASLTPRLVPALARFGSARPWSHTVIIAWCGMRGVVSLAAALALPVTFPERDLIVFLAFCAILATLVMQGTTLEWLIKRLGVEEKRKPGMGIDEATARTLIAHAALREMERRAEDVLSGAMAQDLLPEYRDRVRLLDGISQGPIVAERTARLEHRLHALRAARARLLRHRAEDGVEEELMNRLTEELDLEELRLRRLLGATDA